MAPVPPLPGASEHRLVSSRALPENRGHGARCDHGPCQAGCPEPVDTPCLAVLDGLLLSLEWKG